MARQESDREDLMREATALVRRAEFSYLGRAESDSVIAGFRRDGRLSVYFGADPVYQFDDQNRLRRAYAEGFLYRTQGDTLARLDRHRSAEETLLLRHDLDAEELASFREAAARKLAELKQAIDSGDLKVLAKVPAEADIVSELKTALAAILNQGIPLAPAIPGKK